MSIHLGLTTALRLRLRVWWRRAVLTEALADGADPDSSDELTLVARDLIGMRTRLRLAAGLERLLRRATQPTVPMRSGVPINKSEIVEAYDELTDLAARLRAARPVPVHAVARVAVLLTDGTGPLYDRGSSRPAWDVARTARLALDDPIA
jgi:hypothetical protein